MTKLCLLALIGLSATAFAHDGVGDGGACPQRS